MKGTDLRLPLDLAAGYKSAAQIARIVTEAWVERTMNCLTCNADLSPYAANRKVEDFTCVRCDARYQVKSKAGKFTGSVSGAAYEPTIQAVREGLFPHLVLIEYERPTMTVRDVSVVHSSGITERCIRPRKPLSDSARRAGWKGCTLLLNMMPSDARVVVVSEGKWLDQWHRQWERMNELGERERGGWLADVLTCIESIPMEFGLEDAYAFEQELSWAHPDNNNVRPKIRQQLQVLRDMGRLEFLGQGRYRKVG